jgi:hypothetical protein
MTSSNPNAEFPGAAERIEVGKRRSRLVADPQAATAPAEAERVGTGSARR